MIFGDLLIRETHARQHYSGQRGLASKSIIERLYKVIFVAIFLIYIVIYGQNKLELERFRKGGGQIANPQLRLRCKRLRSGRVNQ